MRSHYAASSALLLSGTVLLSCSPDELAPSPSGDGTAQLGRLDILPSPRDYRAGLPTVDREAMDTPGVLVLHERLALGLGEGYAESIDFRLQRYAFDDGCNYIIGSFAFEEVVSSPEAAAVTLVSADNLLISPESVGQGDIVLRGVLSVDDPSACPDLTTSAQQPFELRIDTSVMETPPGVVFEIVAPCADEPIKYVQSGATLRGTRAIAVDEAGEPIEFANATDGAQVPLTVTADPQTLLEIGTTTEGVGQLTVEGGPGRFTIESETGATEEFALVEASAITSADLMFGLGGGSPQALVDGGVYDGSLGSANFIFALSAFTYMGSTPACTLGRTDDFRMKTPVSSTCSVPAAGDQHLQKFYPEGMGGARVGVDLSVDQSGSCGFEVVAPAFNDGDGWSTGFSVTIKNVTDLLDVGRE